MAPTCKTMLRPAAVALWCAAGASLPAGAVQAQDRYTVSTESSSAADAVAIVPDPAAATPADGTPGSIRLPPLPAAQPLAAKAKRADAPVVTGPAKQAPAADAPIVAPFPAPLADLETVAASVRPVPAAMPSPGRQVPAGPAATTVLPVRPGPIAEYVIHRAGRLWRVRRQGGETATARAVVDFGTMRLAPAIASAARAGLVTLFVDARFVGSRLVVTALAGSVPDRTGPALRPRPATLRWAFTR